MRQIDVLVVDDEKDVYLSTKMALQLLEYEGINANVSYCESASAAICELETNHYQLVFLDIIMETIHAGYKVIDFIHKNETDEHTCVYVRSGQPGNVPEEYLALIDSIDGYIHKTECTMNKLHEIVKTVVQ